MVAGLTTIEHQVSGILTTHLRCCIQIDFLRVRDFVAATFGLLFYSLAHAISDIKASLERSRPSSVIHICIKPSRLRGAWAFHDLAAIDVHMVATGVHIGAYDARHERAIVLEIHEGC